MRHRCRVGTTYPRHRAGSDESESTARPRAGSQRPGSDGDDRKNSSPDVDSIRHQLSRRVTVTTPNRYLCIKEKQPETREWRRRRDSNPRYALTAYDDLANRCLQPLGHVSVIRPVLVTGLDECKHSAMLWGEPEMHPLARALLRPRSRSPDGRVGNWYTADICAI